MARGAARGTMARGATLPATTAAATSQRKLTRSHTPTNTSRAIPARRSQEKPSPIPKLASANAAPATSEIAIGPSSVTISVSNEVSAASHARHASAASARRPARRQASHVNSPYASAPRARLKLR